MDEIRPAYLVCRWFDFCPVPAVLAAAADLAAGVAHLNEAACSAAGPRVHLTLNAVGESVNLPVLADDLGPVLASFARGME